MDIWIEGSRRPRPASARTLYCDGTAGSEFRPGVDLELSHWLPNRTPQRFKASSSTEICLNFAASADTREGFDLAVNNHTDIDGALSMFAAVHPEQALAHRRTLIEAAEIGDFLGWGDDAAMVLCQALKLQQQRMEAQGALLRGTAGLFAGSDFVDAQEFAAYVVEACCGCRWHHLLRVMPLGGRQRRQPGVPGGRAPIMAVGMPSDRRAGP